MQTPFLDRTLTPGSERELQAFLQEYYGRTLERTEDLQRTACCRDGTMAAFGDIVRLIPEEVRQRNYGCGSTFPEDTLDGLTVLDLGCGAGLDCFILSRLVGPRGAVHGIDMTDEQLEVARRNAPRVMDAFGYREANVSFHKGFIETLEPIPDASVDLVVSDCVINLSPRKDRVFHAIHRVLKDRGELYISDIVADRRLPPSLREDRVLVAECLGGALYEFDLCDVVSDAGFRDPRQVRRTLVDADAGGEPARFYSVTLRAFKLDEPLDRRCEDYGQTATYLGGCPGHEARFTLDAHHTFERERPLPVCRNTARMLAETRLGKYFEVSAPRRHFGLFPCGPRPAGSSEDEAPRCC